MIKIANEILDFANSIDDDFVPEYNAELKRKREERLELSRQHREQQQEYKETLLKGIV
ncbi:hypothetical protein [Neobacillus cucumis]|uniref:hypothetical protein n=1 Tax=Neobacillus cucumis TaxID=1740721 RepID=UPI002E208A95|nr:hypothetical protein [Neobacillus cucumis]